MKNIMQLVAILLSACGVDATGTGYFMPGTPDASLTAEATTLSPATRAVPATAAADGGADSSPQGSADAYPDTASHDAGVYCEDDCLVLADTVLCRRVGEGGEGDAEFDEPCINGERPEDHYYSDLPCPYDILVIQDEDWEGSCNGCVDDKIILNGGQSLTFVYRNTDRFEFYCDGDDVRVRAR